MFLDETEMERGDQHPPPFPTDHTTHLVVCCTAALVYFMSYFMCL